MRQTILALMLAASTAQAAPADSAAVPGAAALSPGQAAGVRPAQLTNTNTMLFIGLGVVVLGAGLYLASGSYKVPGQSGQSSTTATSP